MKVYEKDVRQSLIAYLKSQGVSEIGIEILLPDDYRFVDVVFIDEKRRFVCIEVKLTDWRKVIKQAMDCLKYTPLTYIAMPVPESLKIKSEIEIATCRAGLGLYWWHKDGTWDMQYQPSENTGQPKKDTKYYSLQRSLYRHMHYTFMAKCLAYKHATHPNNKEET